MSRYTRSTGWGLIRLPHARKLKSEIDGELSEIRNKIRAESCDTEGVVNGSPSAGEEGSAIAQPVIRPTLTAPNGGVVRVGNLDEGDDSERSESHEARVGTAQKQVSILIEAIPDRNVHQDLIPMFERLIASWGSHWQESARQHQQNYLRQLRKEWARVSHLVVSADEQFQASRVRLRFAQEKLDAAQEWYSSRLMRPTGSQSDGDRDPAAAYLRLPSPRRARLETVIALTSIMFAIATEILAIIPVFGRAFSFSAVFIYLSCTGFAVAGVGLAFEIGTGIRRERSRDPRRSTPLLVAAVVLWVAMLVVVLLLNSLGQGRASSVFYPDWRYSFFASTLWLCALYCCAGLFAMTAAFQAYDPAERALMRATRELDEARNSVINSKLLLEQANKSYQLIEEELSFSDRRAELEERAIDADVFAVVNYARLVLTARMPRVASSQE